MFCSGITIAALVAVASAHMGISDPTPLDRVVGDAYRYPVSSNNAASNGGACHGQAGAKYAWVWTPKSSGQCEIYMNCYADLPDSGVLRMSGGAAHDGGKCTLYQCTGAIDLTPCERGVLPETFGTCTAVATDDDCTTKGSFTYDGSGGGGNAAAPTAALPPTPENAFPPGATASKIRCGSSWTDANGKCGTECKTDSACTNGEKCYADVADCPGSATTPEDEPERPSNGQDCVSLQAHITDTWCRSVECAVVYSTYCGTGASMTSAGLTITTCAPYASFEGETWDDVALTFDTSADALRLVNTHVDGSASPPADTILEMPGDCQVARQQVQDYVGSASATYTSMTLLVLLASSCAYLL